MVEVESLRQEIALLEQERLIGQDQVYQMESQLLDEQKKKFETEQEIEKYTRKGK